MNESFHSTRSSRREEAPTFLRRDACYVMREGSRSLSVLVIVFVALFAAAFAGHAAQTNDLFSDIERLCVLGKKAPDSLSKSIYDRIKQRGTNVSAILLEKLGEQGANEEKLVVYVWALGLCRDPQAVPAIIKLANQSKTEALKWSCFGSLAGIGGDKSGQYLLAALDETKEKEQRFNLFNLLGEMQYEAALPKTIEVLECDPKAEYWRPNFVFGKMGDKAVPFLVEQLNHTNRNVRANAIGILGQWLIAPEAVQPLRDRFWKEEDTEIRGLICCSITATSSMRVFTNFLNEVVAKDKDKKMVEAAKQGLESYPKKKAKFASEKKKKKPSAEEFQREYADLFKSCGKEGSYGVLDISSTLADEPALKKLRERILQRDSDEAFYDYETVSKIIWLNRFPN